MSAYEESTKYFYLPFRVPCPPPALRTPPKTYNTPPPTLFSNSRSVPSPPLGARFPGDRIAWPPLVFQIQKLCVAIPEGSEKEIYGCHQDRASYLQSESSCLKSEIIGCSTDSKHEKEHASVGANDNPTAKMPVAGDSQAKSMVDIQDGLGGLIHAHDEVIKQAGEAFREDGFDEKHSSVESPSSRVELLPAAEVLGRELPLAGDSVVIKELAVLIGIPAYEVLKNLIGLGIFSKTTDSISADVAKKIGCQYGVSLVSRDLVNADECSANCGTLPNTTVPVVKNSFRIANGQHVRLGDWIRDSILGLGRILKLHTHHDESDKHRIWFVGQTEEGTVIEDHPLLPSTLGIIDKSMVPADILKAAPDVEP